MNFIYIFKKNQVFTNDIVLSINLRFPVYQPTQTWCEWKVRYQAHLNAIHAIYGIRL